MANSRYYSSTALQTTLTNSITNSTTIIQVGSTTGFPVSLPYTLALDYGSASEELVEVTGVAGLNLTVTRAIDSTSAQSHAAAAVVKHVSSARDFTDSRTHEAATSAVHGVAGTIVGTTDTQTLTNKTLTSPTINAGALSGTFSGTPTFSGNLTFSGTPTFSNGGALSGTFSGTPTFSGAVALSGGGSLAGTFTGTPTLSGAVVFSGAPSFTGTPVFSAGMQSNRTSSISPSFASLITPGDTFDRYRIYPDGLLEWGSGSGARDTNLYRFSSNTLKTDDSLTVTGDLSVLGIGGQVGARKTADQTITSSTTMTDDTHMFVTVQANAVYTVEGFFLFNALAAADIQIAFTVPVGASGSWVGWGVGLAQSAQTTDGYTLRAEGNTITQLRGFGGIESGGVAQDMGVNAKGLLTTAGTSGTFRVQWAQRISNAQGTIMRQDSWIRLNRIA